MRDVLRRAALVVLVAAAVGAMAFAAGQPETTAPETRVNPPGTFPIVDQMVTIDVWTTYGAAGHDGNYQGAAFTQWYEDLTNVRVNFVEIVEAGMLQERLNLVLASGDLPDVFMNQQMLTHQQVYTNGLFGNFIPVDDLIENWMPALSARLAEAPEYANQLVMPDGKRYTFPSLEGNCYHCTLSRKMWVYMPWLEQLGLDVPQTTEEFYRMLVAFRDRDPNETGRPDTIPLATAASGAWRGGPLGEYLMSAFIYTDATNFLMRTGDTLQFVATTPEWRDGVRYMARLYREGLFLPDSFTQDRAQLVALVESPGPALVGAVNAGWYGVFSINSWDGSGRFADFHPIPPLAGPAGVRQAVFAPHSTVPHTVITRSARHPEVIARWNDWFYESLENFLLADRWERPDVHFRFLTAEERASGLFLGRDGLPAEIVAIPDAPPTQRFGEDRAWDGWRRLKPVWITGGGGALNPATIDDPTDQEWRLARDTRSLYQPYQVDRHLPAALVVEDRFQDELADLQALLISVAGSPGLVERYYAEFVTGARNIDSDAEWNAYVRELERAGAARYAQIWQETLRSAGY